MEKGINILKRLGLYLFILVFSSVVMIYLMYAAYLIPVNKIRENAYRSGETLQRLASWSKPAMYGLSVDTFTDSIILNESGFLGRESFYDALMNPRVDWGEDRVTALPQILSNTYLSDGGKIVNYPRFWHGYLIFLKPLLYFMILDKIHLINLVLQIGLLCLILYLMYKRLGFRHCVAFVTAVCILNPISTWQCLEYANVINVMLLAVLWVLLNKNPQDNFIFFIVGMMTTMFDFITFPLVTLGIPLIMYLCLYDRCFKDSIFSVIKNSLLWLFGYAGMMASKWIWATILTDQNVLQEGWENVLHRTYDIYLAEPWLHGHLSPLYSITRNLERVLIPLSLYLFLLFVSGLFLSYFFSPYRVKFNKLFFVLLGASLMPFVWYAVLVNHSIIHPHWTYKILAITVYAVLASIVCCLKPVENKSEI